MALSLCLATASCGSDEDRPNVAEAGPAPFDLTTAQIGDRQSVYGTVTDALSGNSFEMIDVLVSGEPLLVITPDAAPLRNGMRVAVKGTVQQFDGGTASRFGLEGADLPPVEAGDRFLLAESVDAPVQGTDGS